ncbi:MAG: ABC transporter permease subunit [Clostridiales bacterium]|nr:ABC transporter permease subunit [Clostridiales bacterium]
MIGLRSKRILTDSIIYIVLAVMVVIWLFPLFWMISRAFDVETSASKAGGLVFPAEWTWTNFRNLFPGGPGKLDVVTGKYVADYKNHPYGTWLLNTFGVALGSCVITTLFVLMVSYALSRLKFNSRKKLMNIALILGLFPGFLSMIALYYIFKQFNLTDSLVGLTLAYSLASGTGYYIVKGFFDTVPLAIDEAARIDGATKNRIFWTMIIPLSKPIIVYTILTSFISPWCDYIMASVFISDTTKKTVAVGIRAWIADRELVSGYFARFCAGGVLISVPIVILFLVMQKFYVTGITGGAAKG